MAATYELVETDLDLWGLVRGNGDCLEVEQRETAARIKEMLETGQQLETEYEWILKGKWNRK